METVKLQVPRGDCPLMYVVYNGRGAPVRWAYHPSSREMSSSVHSINTPTTTGRNDRTFEYDFLALEAFANNGI